MLGQPLHEMIADVEAGVSGDDPLGRLAAAAARRDELTDLAEALLDHFVCEAREAKCSWTQIGDALGVSRQAAQQRAAAPATVARSLLARLRPSARSGSSGLFGRMSPAAREAVVAARDAARELRHREIGAGHLLLGLLATDDDAAGASLEAAGATASLVRKELTARAEGPEGMPTGHLQFGSDGRTVMELALRESIRLKAHRIEPAHILLGLLRQGRGSGNDVLSALGVDPGALRSEVEQRLGQSGHR